MYVPAVEGDLVIELDFVLTAALVAEELFSCSTE